MDQSQVYSNFGPLVSEVEMRYSTFLNVPPDQLVTVSSCTLGLQGAVQISECSQWVVPNFTFSATGLAVLNAGKTLLLGEVNEATWALDESVVEGLQAGTGIVPVMPFGSPIDLASWPSDHAVIVDAAASLGTQPDLSNLPESWAVVFSLHATKVMPCGEGGLVVFGNPESAREFRQWSNFGFNDTRSSIRVGSNAKMSEIHAAYGLASHESWPRESREWLKAQSLVAELSLSPKDVDARKRLLTPNPYWNVDCGDGVRRARLEARLKEARISSRVWWQRPLDAMEPFRHAPVIGSRGVAANLAARVLGLPMFRGIQERDIQAIEEVFQTV